MYHIVVVVPKRKVVRIVVSGLTSSVLGSVSLQVPTSLHGVDLMHSSTTIWPVLQPAISP